MAATLVIALVAVTGCKKDEWSDEIGDLQQCVTGLEGLSSQLKQQMDA